MTSYKNAEACHKMPHLGMGHVFQFSNVICHVVLGNEYFHVYCLCFCVNASVTVCTYVGIYFKCLVINCD